MDELNFEELLDIVDINGIDFTQIEQLYREDY